MCWPGRSNKYPSLFAALDSSIEAGSKQSGICDNF